MTQTNLATQKLREVFTGEALSSEPVRIQKIPSLKSKALKKKFIDLPWKIYDGDPFWVPPLKAEIKDLVDNPKNPFLKEAEQILFLAFQGEEVVGRIAGIFNRRLQSLSSKPVAHFGFFESINHPEVSALLFRAVEDWARDLGAQKLEGPFNPSSNHECGLLIDGYADTATIGMTYNPPYYEALFEAYGLFKSKDLLAYDVSIHAPVDERLRIHFKRLKRKSSNLKIREIEMGDYAAELARLREIYNDAWETNWGFVPMDAEEFADVAKNFKMVADPKLILIAEVGGEPAAFAIGLPDINQVLRGIPSGKLGPLGLIKFLWNLKGPGRKKTINRIRIITLGIKKKFQYLGLGPLFYLEYFERVKDRGYRGAEASWILEDNLAMNRALEQMGAVLTKRYRLYRKALA